MQIAGIRSGQINSTYWAWTTWLEPCLWTLLGICTQVADFGQPMAYCLTESQNGLEASGTHLAPAWATGAKPRSRQYVDQEFSSVLSTRRLRLQQNRIDLRCGFNHQMTKKPNHVRNHKSKVVNLIVMT